MTYKKKLIEVALPLDAINKASAREKSIRHGHPSTLHLWWARRPLAAARAVIFSQMVDDPSSLPDLFPTEKKQQKERQRLFKIIEDLVLWESTTDQEVLERARVEIWQSWRRACAENADHARAKELFNRNKLPGFHDPFAGGGALPLEAQRLGLESVASDLNPVAVLINKALIEVPPRFSGSSPVNPRTRLEKTLMVREWSGAHGLAEDVSYYGQWLRDEAQKRIGHLYPKVEITSEMAKSRHDLKPFVGQKLTVIAWLWARTVRSPNPAFRDVAVPLATTFMLSTKDGKEAYVEPVVNEKGYRFTVKTGKPKNIDAAKNGTKLSRGANFRCVMSNTPIEGDYIKAEGTAGRIGVRMMALVAEGEHGRVYLPPDQEMERVALDAKPEWRPDVPFFQQALGFRVGSYGMTKWSDLFTNRQLISLTMLADLVAEVRQRVQQDARDASIAGANREKEGPRNESHISEYADAVSFILALALGKVADLNNALCTWDTGPVGTRSSTGGSARTACIRHLFTRQSIPITWDFAEANPFSESTGSYFSTLAWTVPAVAKLIGVTTGNAVSADAATQRLSLDRVISTDPPYYDNIGYADLSDFFYVWLRRALKEVVPDLFATISTPKAEELVATADRHGGRKQAEAFFLDGMTRSMRQLSEQSHPAFPVTIYYAFKQAESDGVDGTASTGWETFLDAVIRAGFALSGTWPMRTELGSRTRSKASNALASSIILVCRPRPASAATTTRREFVSALKTELPRAFNHLQRSNIAPVDLAQAAIGPGMAIYTRYSRVLDADGKSLTVREALTLINQTLDEVLAEQEGDFDSDTRWALTWFEQVGFSDGEHGLAETLSKAKNTSVNGLKEAGVLAVGRGTVRLLRPDELPANWDPTTDSRLTVWEMVHHLIRILEADGEGAAAALVTKLGPQAEVARELAYRLYSIAERKKRAQEALRYNGLVQSWPEISRLAREAGSTKASQIPLLGEDHG